MARPLEDLTIEQVARFPRPGTVVPAALQFTPDSSALCYLLSDEGSLARGLWRLDVATGERTLIAGPPPRRQFTREEELQRERLRLREEGVTTYAFAERSTQTVLMVPAGDAIRISVDGAPFEDLPGTHAALDPQLSPDGSKVAFVRDGDLYVFDRASGTCRRLSHDACDGVTNGLAEFIAAEELDRHRGFWWSPDSRRIAFIRADSRHIPEYPIVHQGLPRVEVERHRYPFAGEANARLDLAIVDVASGATSWLDLGPDPDIYIARVTWTPTGALAVQVLSRDQQDLALALYAGPEPRIILHEHREPWFNLHDDLRFLPDGSFLWSTEESGFRHLQLRSPDGRLLRTLTSGPWVVHAVVGVDEQRRRVYFAANRESPVERHIYRVSLDGGDIERLSSQPGWHAAVLSRDGNLLALTSSALERAPRIDLVSTSDLSRRPIFAETGMNAFELGLAVPEVVTLPAEDGTPLYGLVYSPARREPGRRYPLVVSVYGGPHAQRAIRDWSSTVDLRAQYLAQQGCVVLKLDNRGSANRGLAFEAHLHRLTGDVEVRDQANAVAWMAQNYHYVDATRTGIYGWSYGGYMTLMCMARRPDVFRVGVAGAPVTHWDGYDTGYTERYMCTPATNPNGYEQSSVMAHLAGLDGELLIVHGMIDENVHFRHTARLLVELARLGKPYEILIYPEERHMPRDARGLEDQERRVLGFLLDRLKASHP